MSTQTGPSETRSWDVELYDAFRAHVQEESDLLDSYLRLGASLESPDVAYLVDLIVEDEQRHHRLFEQLAETLRADIELGERADAVPDVPVRRADAAALRAATAALLRFEREDARRLKLLRRSLKPVAQTTLWPLLVETMELDTRKHILILEHLQRIAEGMPLR
jgi:hypothetical protein